MKRILTSAFVILLTIGAAQAQTTSTGKGQSHHKEQRMESYEKLNLSADQQARLKAVREDFKTQSEELKKQDNLTVAEMKNRREALHKEHQAQVDAILTQEQKAQLATSKRDWKGKEGKRSFRDSSAATKNRKGGMRDNADLERELNLTADQQAKVAQIRAGYKTKVDALRSDNSVAQDAKRERLKELMKQQQEELRTVLTKEQQEKMKSLRKDRPARNTK